MHTFSKLQHIFSGYVDISKLIRDIPVDELNWLVDYWLFTWAEAVRAFCSSSYDLDNALANSFFSSFLSRISFSIENKLK